MLKKIIRYIIFLIAIVLLTISNISAKTPEITINPDSVKPGETISVPVIISDNPGVISLSIDVNFNERQLTLIGVSDESLIPGAMHSDMLHSPYRLIWVNDTSKKDYGENGTLATLTFVVKEDVDADCYLHGSIPKDSIYNYKGEVIDFTVNSKNISVILPEPKTSEKNGQEAKQETSSKDDKQSSSDLKNEDAEKWQNPFTDVSEEDSFYPAVEFVYINDLFRGVSEKRFAPHSTMTRAMFVTVLGRLAGVDQSKYTKSSFTDTKTGEWYSGYVEWAAENGIVNGYGNGKFGVNDDVTVEQAAAIIARYARFAKISTSAKYLMGYEDIDDVSDWAKDDIAWLTEKEIYVPDEMRIRPKEKAERALVATMIYGFSERYSLAGK